VEIRHHHVDGTEAVAGRDEERRLARERAQNAVVAACTFEEPQRGRADRDNTTAGAAHRMSAAAVCALTLPDSAYMLVIGGVGALDR